jgi:hypothetical protein
MKSIIILIVFIIISDNLASSIINNPPYRFDPEEYLFIGEIVAYISTEAVDTNRKFHYSGLMVKAVDEIYMPDTAENFYEIFPLGERNTPIDEQQIRYFYPIRSEVRIVAKKPSVKIKGPIPGNIQLEVNYYSNFSLSINYKNIGQLYSTKESVYNYEYSFVRSPDGESHFKKFLDSLNIMDPQQRILINLSFVHLRDFELRKDLFRLHKANDDKTKAEIIYRLSKFIIYAPHKLIYIITENIRDNRFQIRLLDSFFELRKEITPLEHILGN